MTVDECPLTVLLPFQQIECFDVDGVLGPVDRHHDGQAYSDLSGGDGQGEKDENLAAQVVEVFGEEGPFGGFVRMTSRVLDDPDLAAAGGCG